MTSFLLTLGACCLALFPQDPPPASHDVVVLTSGEELTGTVLVDTPGYVEIRVGRDTVVGFERGQVRELRRGVAVPAASGDAQGSDGSAAAGGENSAPAVPLFTPRDEWFVLHDGEGRCVGTLHATTAFGDDETVRLAEEWDFVTERGRTQVTKLETLPQGDGSVRCFYHERTLRSGEAVPRDERLVRGEYDGARLVLVCTSGRGSERRTYEVGKGLLFPLWLDESLRRRPASLGYEGTRMVFDPGREELRQTAFSGGERRRVEVEGKALDVREVHVGEDGRRNVTWVDATGQMLRREVSGPALVAMASKKDLAQALVAGKAKAFPPAIQREAEGRFSLWLPNPAWRFDDDQVAGHVTAQAPIHDGSVTALVLDQLSPSAHLGLAGDTVERWLRVACRGFKVRQRQHLEVRRQPCLLVEGSCSRPLRGRNARFEIAVVVWRAPEGSFLALCFAAPAAEADELRADFDRMVESLEVHPAQVAAEARDGKHALLRR